MVEEKRHDLGNGRTNESRTTGLLRQSSVERMNEGVSNRLAGLVTVGSRVRWKYIGSGFDVARYRTGGSLPEAGNGRKVCSSEGP